MPHWLINYIPPFALGSLGALLLILGFRYWQLYRQYGAFSPAAATPSIKFSPYLIFRTIVFGGVAAFSVYNGEYVVAGICVLLVAAPFLFQKLSP